MTQTALRDNQAQIEKLFDMMNAGQANGALFALLNEKTAKLQAEREQLQREKRELCESLAPLTTQVDTESFRRQMESFAKLAKDAKPEKIQQLLRLMVRRIEWQPDGGHRVEYYCLRGVTTEITSPETLQDWLYTEVRNGSPQHRNCEPLILEIWRSLSGSIAEAATVISSALQTRLA